jgi:hypothetical protein
MDRPISQDSGTYWQLLGELKLPFGVDAHPRINAWLANVLSPLYLPADFLNKIWKSAEEVAARNIQTERMLKDQHIQLLLYVPASRPLNLKTWGFFRIEKVQSALENENPCDHSIEFYLYLEGQ